MPGEDSCESRRLVQRGHAVANAMPVMAASRIGVETAGTRDARATGDATTGGDGSVRFHGSSFIAGHTGALLAEASRARQEVITAAVGLDAARRHREDWTFLRNRRPDLYRRPLTFDGRA